MSKLHLFLFESIGLNKLNKHQTHYRITALSRVSRESWVTTPRGPFLLPPTRWYRRFTLKPTTVSATQLHPTFVLIFSIIYLLIYIKPCKSDRLPIALVRDRIPFRSKNVLLQKLNSVYSPINQGVLNLFSWTNPSMC